MDFLRTPWLDFYYRRLMKWPEYLIMVRHDVSLYNQVKKDRVKDPLYQEFVKEFGINPFSGATRSLAARVNEKWSLGVSDPDTPLAKLHSELAINTGRRLREQEKLPDVIFVSPYKRTWQTLEGLIIGWPELKQVKIYEEERIREQCHGLAGLYNDWQVFYAFHHEQKRLHDMEGDYWYQWPQGERVPEVRDRIRSWTTTLTRDFSNQRVLAVSHHMTKLAIRANFERWSAEEFMRVDKEDKPINCGVTKYVGVPHLGKNGRFKLEYYNRDLSV